MSVIVCFLEFIDMVQATKKKRLLVAFTTYKLLIYYFFLIDSYFNKFIVEYCGLFQKNRTPIPRNVVKE